MQSDLSITSDILNKILHMSRQQLVKNTARLAFILERFGYLLMTEL